MKYFAFFTGLLPLVLFVSCSGEKTDNGFSNDLENIAMWTNTNSLVNMRGFAHSGTYISRLDSVNGFSVAFEQRLGTLSADPVSVVHFKAWVLFKNANCKANLVVTVQKQDSVLYWKAFKVDDVIKSTDKWEEVKESFVLPKQLDPSSKLVAYVWNTGKEEVFVDDLSVGIE